MATVPADLTWSSPFLTTVEFNRISSHLRFLSYRLGGFCELIQTVVQDIPANTDQPITFQNEEVDRDGGHDNLAQLSRYTVHTSGAYMLSGLITYAANATGFRAAKLVVNGSTTLATSLRGPQTDGTETFVPVGSRLVRLNVGDYVELHARQSTAGTLQTSIADAGSGMSVVFMGI